MISFNPIVLIKPYKCCWHSVLYLQSHYPKIHLSNCLTSSLGSPKCVSKFAAQRLRSEVLLQQLLNGTTIHPAFQVKHIGIHLTSTLLLDAMQQVYCRLSNQTTEISQTGPLLTSSNHHPLSPGNISLCFYLPFIVNFAQQTHWFLKNMNLIKFSNSKVSDELPSCLEQSPALPQSGRTTQSACPLFCCHLCPASCCSLCS